MQGAYGGLICILMYGKVEGSPPVLNVLLETDSTPILLTTGQYLMLA
jgi:hypothetical protein